MHLVDAMIEELRRPTDVPQGPLHAAYDRGVVGIAHLALGGAVAGILWPVAGPWDAAARLCVAGAYFATKELADLRRGGTLRDGIEDAACVGLGLFYAGQWYAPAVAILIGVYLMARGAARGLK